MGASSREKSFQTGVVNLGSSGGGCGRQGPTAARGHDDQLEAEKHRRRGHGSLELTLAWCGHQVELANSHVGWWAVVAG